MHMTYRKLFAAAVLAVSAAGLGARGAEPATPDALIKELTTDGAAAARTPQQLAAAYTQAVAAVTAKLADASPDKRGDAQKQMERLGFHASRPGAETERAAFAAALAARLEADLPPAAKVWVLRHLEFVGRAESVPPVAAQLAATDPALREAARQALQNNPAPEAAAALRAALESADAPVWKAALANALGTRGDTEAAPALAKLAASDDEAVRSAAVVALAKVGDKSALDPIASAMTKGSEAAKLLATDACLRLADRLTATDKATALAVYRKLTAQPGQVKAAALIGMARAGGAAELPALMDALDDADPRTRGAATEGLILLTAPEVTRAMADRLAALPAASKPVMLYALARRGDKAARSAVAAAAADADVNVRVAALRSLATLGDKSDVTLLLKAAAQGPGEEQKAARDSLDIMAGGAEIDAVLVGALATATGPGKAEVARALGARKVAAGVPALTAATADPDPVVRQESFKALGVVGGPDVLPALVSAITKTTENADRDQAVQAYASIARRAGDADRSAQPALAALPAAEKAGKVALYQVLGRVGGAKALDAVAAGLAAPEPALRDAALRALADWPDDAAAPALLEVARSAAKQNERVVALRGYVRVVAQPGSNRAPAETTKMLGAALAVAQRPEDVKTILPALGDLKDPAALALILPHLDLPATAEEAANAAAKVGRATGDTSTAAATIVNEAMPKVLAATKNENTKKLAQEALDRAQRKAPKPR